MECNEPVPPTPEMQSGPGESGHLFYGGHAFQTSFNMARPPPFWGPMPPFQGFGPRPYHFPPPPRFVYGPPVFSAPPPSIPTSEISSVLLNKSEDAAWLNNWLQSRPSQQQSSATVSQNLSISRAQEMLQHCFDVLKDMEEECNHLQKEVLHIPDSGWNVRWGSIEGKKSEVSEIFNVDFSDKALSDLQKKVQKRSRKRLRLKSQQAKQRKDAYLAQMRRQCLHQKADAWMADMQLAVDRARKNEEMKREADTVLAEVTRRQTEGRRQIALLEALQKLHQARVQTLEGRGSKLSVEDKNNLDHSALVFNRLLAMWSNKMDVYGKEEHGLRVMLEESAARKGDLEIQKVRSTLKKWEVCLFGSESSFISDEPYDINSLVSIRYAWDQYLVPEGVPMASTIPVGWILPTTPSSSEWQNLLDRQ